MRIKERRGFTCVGKAPKAGAFPILHCPHLNRGTWRVPDRYLLSHRPEKENFPHSASAVQTLFKKISTR